MGSPKQIQALFLTLVGFLFTSASSLAVTIDELNAQKEFERRQAEIQAKKPEELEYMPQSDAFASAAEHATFLAVHQMSFGPYGVLMGEEKNKVIKNTAEAIDICLKGDSDCSTEKKQLILKALVQYNLGQEIKSMMVINNTNQEKIKSIQSSSLLDQTAIQESLRQGKDFAYTNDPQKHLATKEGKENPAKLGGSYGRGKDPDHPYFQLDEKDVVAQQDMYSDQFKDNEILGKALTEDYNMLIQNYGPAKEEDSGRFYKFIPADENDPNKGSILASNENGNPIIDKRFSEIREEQNNPNVIQAVNEYKDLLKNPKFELKEGKNGEPASFSWAEGFNPKVIGTGAVVKLDPRALNQEVKIDDLVELDADNKPELKGLNMARAAVRLTNKRFQDTAEENFNKKRNLASPGNATEAKLEITNITLDPQKFSEFLDDIWPTAERRRELQNQ